MNKFGSFLTVVLLVVLSTACNKDDNKPAADNNTNTNGNVLIQQINALPKEPLSQDEKESILLMREEEKMARDAYLNFYQFWSTKIFQNISNSEQTHMDAVLQLINKYGLTDPVGTKPVGSFSNPQIQVLYNAFISQGKISNIEALKAGAGIEEVDIRDLQNLLNEDDINNQDIELVYNSLLKGSRNHLRSFAKVLNSQGVTYVPLYLSQSEYDAIINSPMETGM